MATQYDFDTIIPRRGTGSLKWDKFPELDPFWVADMDFKSSPAILETIQQRISHGVLGYAKPHDSLIETLIHYMQQRHSVRIQGEDIVHLGGLVCALSMTARAFGKAGDSIMTCTPIYPPFLAVHHDLDMECITTPLIHQNEQWTFDWESMEKTVTPDTKIFLLSNPQNPLGRVFTKEEIEKLANFCERHDLILVSDEIHCDLILDEHKTPHFCAASLPDELQKRIVTLLAPSKTYNIAGIGYSFAVIKDNKLRAKFEAAKGHILPEINCIAYYAAESAYRDGEPWRQELLTYLRKNRDTITEFVHTRLTGCTIPNIEATYLALIDCRKHFKNGENPADFFEKKANLYFSDGNFFDAPGQIRFNFGCPHSRLLEGLEKMEHALLDSPN